MRARLALVLAGAALAIGGGVTGAVVVAPKLADSGPSVVEVREAAAKEARASLQHTFHVAKKARGMARGARELGNGLVPQVQQAQDAANNALGTANNANSRLDSQQSVSDVQAGKVTTGSTGSFVALSGGPEVTVEVPQSGLVEVFASALIGDEDDPAVAADGVVALYEDGQKVPIAASPTVFPFCDVPGLEGPLFINEGSTGEEMYLSTPPVLAPLGCGVMSDKPSGVLLNRSPGQHTYELRYGDCDCDPAPAAFSQRTLRVVPIP
jgi:hypothetical protein